MPWDLCYSFTFLLAYVLDAFQENSLVLAASVEEFAMMLGLLVTVGTAALEGELSSSRHGHCWRFVAPLCQLCFCYAMFQHFS